MSEDSKKLIDSINNGILPPLNAPITSGAVGLDISERGLVTKTFGLQKVNEQFNKKK